MNDIKYEITPYKDEDYEFVYELKKGVYRSYVEQNWGEWNEVLQRDLFVKFMNEYSKDILIISIQNKKIGFVHGKENDLDEFEIGNICIVPECQNKGIGSKILAKYLLIC